MPAESWKRIDERKGFKTLFTVTSDCVRDALKFRCREVQRSMHNNKMKFDIILVREDASECNDFRSVYHIMQVVANLSMTCEEY